MRMPISQINVLSRVTQGVRLINLKDNQQVSSICLIKDNENSDNSTELSTDISIKEDV